MAVTQIIANAYQFSLSNSIGISMALGAVTEMQHAAPQHCVWRMAGMQTNMAVRDLFRV